MPAKRVCSVPGCPALTVGGRCDAHRSADRRARYLEPSTFNYDSRTWKRTRAAVLRRDAVCVECQSAASTVADHYPVSRRELIAIGVPDPDGVHRLRGVCARCHNRHTARHQPGGWAAGGG